VRINPTIITGTSYTDLCLLYPGTYTYMVRAILLQLSPSGTYYNMSQGISDTAWNNNNLAVHAIASNSVVNNVATFTNASTNATTYQWNFGDATTSTSQNPSHTYTNIGNYTVTLIASNGCDADTITMTVSILSGIESANNAANISIYPNPSSGKFHVSFDAKQTAKIKIYNLSGELLMAMENSSGNCEIDLSDYPNGVYFLSVETEKGISREKILVQK